MELTDSHDSILRDAMVRESVWMLDASLKLELELDSPSGLLLDHVAGSGARGALLTSHGDVVQLGC